MTQPEKLFSALYGASTESELDKIFESHSNLLQNPKNWRPLGDNENNFGVIENQQASPIASLIEKITNSIDAIMMKKCYEAKIDPKSDLAPRSLEGAIEQFYPDHRNWDLDSARREQSLEIQILADGPKRDTSLIIYDNGEGQHPDKFENTFLSLLRGNKNEIHFVQGKYNMGGSGAIVFCGKKGYQLIASKRWDGTGEFGFTLIRQHPFGIEEQQRKKNTWYEYLVLEDKIPSFPIKELDLGLHKRKFQTGSIIKLYSFQIKNSSAISHDLNQSINEFLFKPALPIITVDKEKRYPNDKALTLPLFGLKRRLDDDNENYIQTKFSEEIKGNEYFGKAKISCFVFKSRVKDWDVKKTKENIKSRYFKNDMSVLFSLNGQVHGAFTQEFISRSLKMNLLKEHLLIHVDCTDMNYDFRKELFMASRDRLKNGEETRLLRHIVAEHLKKGKLAEIEKERKNSISVDGGDTRKLLKDFTQNLPQNSELFKLLDDAFKLDLPADKSKKQKEKPEKKQGKEKEKFQGKRYPSFLRLKAKNDGETPVAHLPLGGERVLRFETDVENYYFDRVEEPGELKVALVNFVPNGVKGDITPKVPGGIEEILNVTQSSPDEGTIKVALGPKKDMKVGDMAQVKVTLGGEGGEFDELFWVKVSNPDQPQEKKKKEDNKSLPQMGLPDFILVYEKENKEEEKEKVITWERLAEGGIEMDFANVMYPSMKGDVLEKIYINMDSNVLRRYKSKFQNISLEQTETAHKKYITSVYFHTLFLYTITKKRGYRVMQTEEGKNDKDVDLGDYLSDIFDHFYSEFILSFGMESLMASLN